MSDWLLPYDGSTWNDFPGEPTIYPEPTGVRQHKFMFDALYIANLNVTDNPEEADKLLDNSRNIIFQDKREFSRINRELGIPVPREYDYDEIAVDSIDHPVVLKPVQGKGAVDMNGSQIVYRAFQNGRALRVAFQNDNVPFNAAIKKKLYFVQEALNEPNGDTTQIQAMVLVNGNRELRTPYIFEQTWKQNPSYNMELGIISPTTRETHKDICEEYVRKICKEFDLKNTCVFVQCIIKDGVYYYTDIDTRIPNTYCNVSLIEYLPEHLRFMYDAANDITIPDVYIAHKDLKNLRLSPEYHEDLLASRYDEFDAFYWIARRASSSESQDGRYFIMVSGDSVEDATTKLNNYVNYLTVE